MDPVRTHQELLLNLAGDGDPSAFSTLIVQYANAAYINERNSGKSHKEALSVLVPFIKSAYQDFIKTSPHKAFDTWYREYKRKYFSSAPDTPEEVNLSDKTDFVNVPMADIAHFERILDIILQRKYGKMKKVWNGRLMGNSRQLQKILKKTAIIAGGVIAVVAFYHFLSVTKQRIIITYSIHDSMKSISVPFSTHLSPNTDGRFRPAGSTLRDSLAAQIKVHDTLIIHDTLRIAPRWKPVVQNKAAAVTSQGNATTPPPPPASPAVLNKQASPLPVAPVQGTTIPKPGSDSLQ